MQGVDISVTVCLFVCMLLCTVTDFLSEIKLAASYFAWWFIGVLCMESHILENFAPQKPKIGRIGQRTASARATRTGQLAGQLWKLAQWCLTSVVEILE